MFNILPDIRKNKRKPHFANPLSGLIYNNNNFVRTCYPQNQQEITLISTRNIQSKTANPNKLSRSLFYKTHHISNAEPIKHKTNTQHHYLNATQQFLNHSRTKFTKIGNKNQMNQTTTFNKPQKNSTKQKQTNPQNQFPDIQIKILDLIQSIKDPSPNSIKHLKVNFVHYFLTFFHKSLSGKLTKQFLQFVQKYLIKLVGKKQLDKKVDPRDYPAQIYKIKSKRGLLEKALYYEDKGQHATVQVMIRKYCVPEPHLRQSCYQDILFMLSRCLYQKYNMNKDNVYILLDENGKPIQDICEIKFDTRLLFITQKQKSQKMYEQYNLILDNNDEILKKISFSETLKKNFREKIVRGKVDEQTDVGDKNNQKKMNLFYQDKMQYKSPNRIKNSPPKTAAANYNMAVSTRSPHSRPNTNNNFHKQTRQLPQNNAHKKQLETQNNFHHETSSPLNFHQEKHKRQTSILDEIQQKKRYQKYEETFTYLINQNSYYSITFNHQNQNKVLIKTLKKFLNFFSNKTQSQINKIMEALELKYQKDSNNIEIDSIEFDDFVRLSEVATCKGEKENIINFINNYVDWNQFEEINRQRLGNTIQFAIGSHQDPAQTKYFLQSEKGKNILNDLTQDNKSVIEQVIWSWLERNKLIQNDCLSKNKLQSWYKKYKLAYVLLVSLIFGTNVVSLMDIAYQVVA